MITLTIIVHTIVILFTIEPLALVLKATTQLQGKRWENVEHHVYHHKTTRIKKGTLQVWESECFLIPEEMM